MNPEDKYNIKYWKILKNIKDKILLSDHNLIEYKIYSGILIVGHDEPSQTEELIIIKRIEKEGGIKIAQNATDLIYTGLTDLRFDLIVLPKFEELYNKYKQMNEEYKNQTTTKDGISISGSFERNILGPGATLIGIQNSKKETIVEDKNFWDKLTNNQTFAVIIGGLVLLFIIYLIFKYSGVNLTQFR